MASATVRLREPTRAVLRRMADESGEAMSVVLEKAIEAYRRQRFLEQVNAAYAALRADPEAWSIELEERRSWDATLMDGIDDEEDDAWQ